MLDETTVFRYMFDELVGFFSPIRYIGQDYGNEVGFKNLYVAMKTHIAMAKWKDGEDPLGEVEEDEDEYITYSRMTNRTVEAMEGVIAQFEEAETFVRKHF